MSDYELAALLSSLKLPEADESLCDRRDADLIDPDMDSLDIFGGAFDA
jgi:hypothetical protein